MIRLIAVAFALTLATSVQAMSPAPLHQPDGMITQIREACGAGRVGSLTFLMWRAKTSTDPAAPPGPPLPPAPRGGGGESADVRMSLDQLARLEASGAPVVVLADARTERSARKAGEDAVGGGPAPAGRRGEERAGAATAARGVARRVLRLTERGHERPCGARAEAGGLAARPRAHRRLRRVEGGRTPGAAAR